MYLTYYVHLIGIKRRNCLQEFTELEASIYAPFCLPITKIMNVGYDTF